MDRIFVVLILSGLCLCLSSCRDWVLYEFAEQFCEFEEYVAVSWHGTANNKHVKIVFEEPVLDRSILLYYFDAIPFESQSETTVTSVDLFAIRQTHASLDNQAEPVQFTLGYHPLNEHALLESAYLDSKLSELFPPVLVEPLLRSLCSDNYDLSLKQLNIGFKLPALPKRILPSVQKLIAVFGKAEETIVDASGVQSLRYEFDFLMLNKQQNWQAQQKPITMLFDFDPQGQLKKLYIHYHKYSYWLDVENLSGRLLVIRGE